MKVFFVTAFALCYYVAKGNPQQNNGPNPAPNPGPNGKNPLPSDPNPKVLKDPNYQLGPTEVECLKKLGIDESKNAKPRIQDYCSAYRYLQSAQLYLAQFDSVIVEKIFNCIKFRLTDLTRQDEGCLEAVLPPGGVKRAVTMISDVRKVFLGVAGGNTTISEKSMKCLLGHEPRIFKGFNDEFEKCAGRIILNNAVQKFSFAYHHVRTDLEYVGHGFGYYSVSRALKQLKIETMKDLVSRVMKSWPSKSLFSVSEHRTGELLLPGQFGYILKLVERFRSALFQIRPKGGKKITSSALKKAIKGVVVCINAANTLVPVHFPAPKCIK